MPEWAAGTGTVDRAIASPTRSRRRRACSINGGKVNGRTVPPFLQNGYAEFSRRGSTGDMVMLDMPMQMRRVLADSRVTEDAGKAAIQRGPILYALEGIDNGGSLNDVVVPVDAAATHAFRSDLLNGVRDHRVEGRRRPHGDGRPVLRLEQPRPRRDGGLDPVLKRAGRAI